MDASTIRKMKKIDEFLNRIYNINGIDEPKQPEEAFEMLMRGKGHVAKHISEPKDFLLKRLVNEGLYCSTTFKNTYEAVEQILNALMYQTKEITLWLEKGKEDFSAIQDYNMYSFTLHMGNEELVGTGFDRKYNEYETSNLRIILERDFHEEHGFHIVTAHPDITIDDFTVKKTGELSTRTVVEDIIKPERYMEKTAYCVLPELPEKIQMRLSNKQLDNNYLSCILIRSIDYPDLGAEIRRNEVCLYSISQQQYIDADIKDYPELKKYTDKIQDTYNFVRDNKGQIPSTKDEIEEKRNKILQELRCQEVHEKARPAVNDIMKDLYSDKMPKTGQEKRDNRNAVINNEEFDRSDD